MANIAYIKKRIRNKKYAGVPINVEPSNFKYTLEQLEHFFSND
jgi:hypothetical protein